MPRPRSEQSRTAILEAAASVLEEEGWAALTVDAVARRAGVGRQTIYRWWGGDLGEVVVEAWQRSSDERVEPPDTGSVEDDLLAVLVPVASMSAVRTEGVGRANRALMAHAQVQPGFEETYRRLHAHWRAPLVEIVRRGVERGELAEGADPELVVDLLLGIQWYRLLLGHLPLDEATARASVAAVLDGVRR